MTIPHYCGGRFERFRNTKKWECSGCATDAKVEVVKNTVCVFERPRPKVARRAPRMNREMFPYACAGCPRLSFKEEMKS
jgi:hypothetical protein